MEFLLLRAAANWRFRFCLSSITTTTTTLKTSTSKITYCKSKFFYSTNSSASSKYLPKLIGINQNRLLSCSSYSRSMENRFKYPAARRDESAVDTYHGVEVKDPYRWLEDPEAPEVIEFVEAQQKVTKAYLETCPNAKDIHDRLKASWNYPKYSCPLKHGGKYYFYKNNGLQNQSVLYVQDTLESEPKVFFDPNTLSEDGSVAISIDRFSHDGNIFGYSLSSSGSDWSTIYFINTKTGEKYPDKLEKVKYSSMAWTHDNLGVFYGTYLDRTGKADGSETFGMKNQKLCYHRIGTDQSEDVIVVEFPEEPLWRIGAEVSDCGDYLILTPLQDCRDNLVYFAKLKDVKIEGKLELTKVVDKMEAGYEYVTNNGSKMVFLTNKNAPNYRLVTIDFDNYVEEKWVDLIPEDPKHVLDWADAVANDKLVVCYIQDVKNVLQLHSLENGQLLNTFPLDVGSIIGFSGDRRYTEFFYQFTSFLTSSIIYRVDLAVDTTPSIYREIKCKEIDTNQFKTTQIFYESKDGTKVPMFIIMKKDAPLDGSMPALMYGYGGFNVSIQPTFSVTRLIFMEHFNGVCAIPNIRGGGEYGEKWHSGGRLMNKQNVFDDFHAAGEYLIKNGYCHPKKLTIQGGSNGGLLVAACVNQRPTLYSCAIAEVGVMDMLKFHKFTIGYAWISDYGSSDEEKHFHNLIKYSPLHNVKAPSDNSTQYPATLLLTADHDDRVVPLHSLKLIATLQHTLAHLPQQTNPIMIRIETKAGHGRGKPTSKLIESSTDILSFMMNALKLEYHK